MIDPPVTSALVLVDLQHDFLARPGLAPAVGVLCGRSAALLDGFRRLDLPVAHVQTWTRADGTDRMPHWVESGVTCCVEGTPGAAPPLELTPHDGELVVRKQFFNGFGGSPSLDEWLRARDASRLVVAGVYSHGCVRETAVDAYERGYEVWIADDAIATTEAVHGAVSRAWLSSRAARLLPVDEILAELGGDVPPAAGSAHGPGNLPVAVVDGHHRTASGRRHQTHHDPCRSEQVLAHIPLGTASDVADAAAAAAAAQTRWSREPTGTRAALLERWATALDAARPELVAAIVRDVGKPRRAADDETDRAIAHIDAATALLRGAYGRPLLIGDGVAACHRPVGVVGLVMPWNNPLALPVGKIAPALAFGNAAVLKPAPEGSRIALALLESLARAGAPTGLVNVVLGDREAAEALCDEPAIDAVSVTGSIATGRSMAARCAATLKPLQAELGGNNAAIVLADADLETVVPALLRGAFAFAGQRCTAIRRFVVERAAIERFETLARETLPGIALGHPDDPETEVGPLVSVAARDRVAGVVREACSDGARVVAAGTVPTTLDGGAWLAPVVVTDVDPMSPVAQEETFGPVAVVLPAVDLDEALSIANGVPQGLVLAVCTTDERARGRVLDEGRAGIVQVGAGPLPVHPDAPFGGWKASGIGPPEHGQWDAAFYARPVAVYGDGAC